MKKKYYQVVATTYYGGKKRTYVVGEFTSKREANICFNRQYTTVSRTFEIIDIKK